MDFFENRQVFPPGPTGGPRGAGPSKEESPENTEVQWDITDKNFGQEQHTHQKLGLRIVISGITVRFNLCMKTKERYFELFMESQHDRDLELDLEIKLEFKNYKRIIKGVFIILGRNEKGQYQSTSLFWDNLTEMLDNGRRPEATVHIKFHRMMHRCTNYPKPRFNKESSSMNFNQRYIAMNHDIKSY